MSLRQTIAIIAVVWIVVLGAVYWEARELGQRQRLLAERAARRLEVDGQIRAMTRRAAAARKANASISAMLEKLRSNGRASAQGGTLDFRGVTATNPELRRLYLKGFTADLYAKFGLLFKKLGLSSDQIDKFNAIQLRLEGAKLDLTALSETDGVPLTSPEVAAQLGQADRDANQDLRSLLGDANYDAYRSYYQTSNVLVLVTDLPNFTSAGTDPLTVSQDEQLTQIMADASARNKYGYAIYGTVNWQLVMPQAQAMLEPAQYDALQLLQAQKSTWWQMMKLTNPLFGTAAWKP